MFQAQNFIFVICGKVKGDASFINKDIGSDLEIILLPDNFKGIFADFTADPRSKRVRTPLLFVFCT